MNENIANDKVLKELDDLDDLDLEKVSAGAGGSDIKGLTCGAARTYAALCDAQNLPADATVPR